MRLIYWFSPDVKANLTTCYNIKSNKDNVYSKCLSQKPSMNTKTSKKETSYSFLI